MTVRIPKVSQITLRKQEIAEQIETTRLKAAARTRQDLKTDQGWERWQRRWPEKIQELQTELSILDEPDKYDELPFAVVADQLGISIGEVKTLVWGGELEPSDLSYESKRDRVARAEIERAQEIGVEELLRLNEQTSYQIFEAALPYLQSGDILQAQKAYRRLEARGSLTSDLTSAFRIALDLLIGDIEEAGRSFKWAIKRDGIDRTSELFYLGRLLRVMRFKENCLEILRGQMLMIIDGATTNPYANSSQHDQTDKRIDEMQQRAMYIAAAVGRSLEKYRSRRWFLSSRGRPSEIQQNEFDTLIRNAIYTALYAEAGYADSPINKMHFEAIKNLIPSRWGPASLLEDLEDLPVKDATAN